MNDGPRRRRRLDDDSSGGGGGGWFPVLALSVVVVLIGLALGAGAARFFGRHGAAARPTPLPTFVVPRASMTPLAPETPVPTPSVAPTLSPTPSPRASATSTPTATPTASSSPLPTATPRRTPTPAAAPTTEKRTVAAPIIEKLTPHRASPTRTAPPKTATPTPLATQKPSPATSAQRAEQIVRLYLDALAAGDVAQARSYLASGSPDETFMNRSAHINYIRQNENGNGTYAINADVTTDSGEYFFTFTVEVSPGGAVILDHTAIKP